MEKQTYDLSIIVVNWKVKDLLKDCLNSVYNTVKNHLFEVIVIDNDSQDGSIEMLKAQFPHVRLVENFENVGHSRAMNQGIKLSKGEFVILLNPDVVLLNGSLDKMVDFLRSNPKTGAAGGKELRPGGKFFWRSRRRKIVPWIEIIALFGGNRLRNVPLLERFFPDEWMRDVPEDQLCKVAILSTACMMVRREVFDTIGLLDETFWLMSEDVDISLRMGQAGWDIYYLPQAPFYHCHGESIKKSKKSIHMIIIGERYVLFRKFWNHYVATMYRTAVFFAGWFRLLSGFLANFYDYKLARMRRRDGFAMVRWFFNPVPTPKG